MESFCAYIPEEESIVINNKNIFFIGVSLISQKLTPAGALKLSNLAAMPSAGKLTGRGSNP